MCSMNRRDAPAPVLQALKSIELEPDSNFEAMFTAADTDGDGLLSFADFARMYRGNLGVADPSEAEDEGASGGDGDGDGDGYDGDVAPVVSAPVSGQEGLRRDPSLKAPLPLDDAVHLSAVMSHTGSMPRGFALRPVKCGLCAAAGVASKPQPET